MGLWNNFKRDITKHRWKAVVLGCLFVAMVVMSVRAALDLRPRTAGAEIGAATLTPTESVKETISKETTSTESGEAEERIRQSRQLWQTLREVRGVDANIAFTFDPAFYPADPARKAATPNPENSEPSKPLPASPAVNEVEIARRAQFTAIREQSRALVVQSTTVGNTNSKPMAIVNKQLLSVGDHLMGFEISAIRSREVEFTKEGVTIAVKMPDESRGQ